MKRINNRGVTLIELLVSIAMLGTVMILMYSLMTNIQNKKNNVDMKADDMIKIADMETKLQKAIMKPINYGRTPVSCVSISGDNHRKTVTIKRDNNTVNHTISASSNVINYSGNGTHKWTLKEGKNCSISSYISYLSSAKLGIKPFANITIECEDNNNKTVDYIGVPMLFKGNNIIKTSC